ncbi:hypothetical protein [Arthrobacter sp. UM1]|uniref:hypothetical protein n=1 Tax=Arthrobacter sp. UM1 TaxID=2766776 RepID=UPI001CF6A204|nr:hypothetical protein [Arthrobacter sp. UM1]MCB4209166.1 hypothetical protein [Arthrobacter sp. UM1]
MSMELHAYLGLSAESELTRDCAAQAETLVAQHIGTASVPEAILARAVLEVGADLYHRQRARLGVVGLDGPDVQPLRVRTDPMTAAYPLLRPYLAPVIA